MLVSRWINEMVANSSSCDSIGKVVSSHGSLITILGLDEVQRFFLIIAGGLALSFLIFLLEIVLICLGMNYTIDAAGTQPYR